MKHTLVKLALPLLISMAAFADYSQMYEQDNFNQTLKETAIKVQEDLNKGLGMIETKHSSNSGTSAYLKYKFKEDGHIISQGALLPKAEATDVLGEIVSYHLARALGFGNIYAAKTLIKVEDQGLKNFKAAMKNLKKELRGKEGMRIKKENLKQVLKFIKNEKTIWAAFAPWGHRPYDFESVRDEKHPLRQAIQARGKHPSQMTEDEIKSFRGKYKTTFQSGTISPQKMARELSNHMVIDILTGQYDRWTGGNLQYFIDDNGMIHIGAFDNGGTFEWSAQRFKRYFKIVSRFDAATVNKLKQLKSFLNGEERTFSHYSNIQEFYKDMELTHTPGLSLNQIRSPKSVRRKIKYALDKLIEHIDSTCERLGVDRCLF